MFIEQTKRNEELVVAVVGRCVPASRRGYKNAVLRDYPVQWINGRWISGYVPECTAAGEPVFVGRGDDRELVVRRQRFRIPKGHPWRGRRPSAALLGGGDRA